MLYPNFADWGAFPDDGSNVYPNNSMDLDLNVANMGLRTMKSKHAFPYPFHRLGKNHMANYTFYTKETHLMFVSNVASSALFVLGLASNLVSLWVLDATLFARTSFKVYLKWVCYYHMISLGLTVLRQHTFLLDFMDHGPEFAHQRFWACSWILFFYILIEQCTTASLVLLMWNRIWAQRKQDRTQCGIDAMRKPILLNISAMLMAAVPTSFYIEAYRKDAVHYDMTMCSFAFLHKYGSPRLQEPGIIHDVYAIEEVLLFASLSILIVEMILRAIRTRTGGRLKFSDFIGSNRSLVDDGSDTTTETGPPMEAPSNRSLGKARFKESSLTSQFMATTLRFTDHNYYDERDISMSYLTVLYMAMYFCMGMPVHIVPYFIELDHNDFPLLMLLSLLRQSFQASTILHLSLGSDLIRDILTDLSGQLPAVQYTSSTALFEPNTGQDMGISRTTRWLGSIEESVAAASNSTTPGRLDKLELGLNKSEMAHRPTLLLSKHSVSHTNLASRSSYNIDGINYPDEDF